MKKELKSWQLLLLAVVLYAVSFLIGKGTVETKLVGSLLSLAGFVCFVAFIILGVQKIIKSNKKK